MGEIYNELTKNQGLTSYNTTNIAELNKANFDIEKKYVEKLDKAAEKGAMFDARVFNIPKEEAKEPEAEKKKYIAIEG